MAANITNIFVLMLENRSFDHMLGFSGITGTDAETGQPTTINGLTGAEANSYQGQPYPVVRAADDTMPIDPGHEFLDVVKQLCGENATYPLGGPYPPSITAALSLTTRYRRRPLRARATHLITSARS